MYVTHYTRVHSRVYESALTGSRECIHGVCILLIITKHSSRGDIKVHVYMIHGAPPQDDALAQGQGLGTQTPQRPNARVRPLVKPGSKCRSDPGHPQVKVLVKFWSNFGQSAGQILVKLLVERPSQDSRPGGVWGLQPTDDSRNRSAAARETETSA